MEKKKQLALLKYKQVVSQSKCCVKFKRLYLYLVKNTIATIPIMTIIIIQYNNTKKRQFVLLKYKQLKVYC